MSAITIENIPPELQRQLEQRAARHRQTLAREILEVLQASVREPHSHRSASPAKFAVSDEWLDPSPREGGER